MPQLMQTDKVQAALNMAKLAHKGQKRWGGEPYITHPIAVAESILTANPHVREHAQVVALLHDTIEDTSITKKDIAFSFGDKVANDVEVLTRKDNETYTEYVARVALVGGIPALVKVADLAHNMSDLKPSARRDKYELASMYIQKVMKHV